MWIEPIFWAAVTAWWWVVVAVMGGGVLVVLGMLWKHRKFMARMEREGHRL